MTEILSPSVIYYCHHPTEPEGRIPPSRSRCKHNLDSSNALKRSVRTLKPKLNLNITQGERQNVHSLRLMLLLKKNLLCDNKKKKRNTKA